MLKEMPELRAPENSRIGIEIKPKVRYPDQTEAAIVHPVKRSFSLERARALRVASLEQVSHFFAPDFVQLSKLEASYVGVSLKAQLGLVFIALVRAWTPRIEIENRRLSI
jgi:hypothetical protein